MDPSYRSQVPYGIEFVFLFQDPIGHETNIQSDLSHRLQVTEDRDLSTVISLNIINRLQLLLNGIERKLELHAMQITFEDFFTIQVLRMPVLMG